MSYNSIQQVLESFLFNQDFNQRKTAEDFLNQIPNVDFYGGLNQYLSALSLPKSELSELAALMLKKQYIDNEDNLQKISIEQQTEILQKVQQSITSTPRNYLYIKRAVEIIIKLYTLQKRTLDLINFLNQQKTTSDINLKKGLTYLIETMCEYSLDDDDLMKYFNEISQILTIYMEDKEIQVRAYAFKSLIGFLCAVQEDKLLKNFEQIFPNLIKKCVECIQIDQLESGTITLNSLIDLIEIHPKFTKNFTNDFLALFNEILTSNLSQSIKIKSLSGIMVLAQNNPNLLRKNTDFKQKTVPIFIQMISLAKDLPFDEWSEQILDQALSKNDLSSAAEDILGKIGESLSNKFLFPIFFPLIIQALNQEEWNFIRSGLVCISQLINESGEMIKKEIKNVMSLLQKIQKKSFQKKEDQIRIQYDILTTYASLCVEYYPNIQYEYFETIFSCVLENIKSDNLKLQFRAVSTIINFFKEIIEEDEDEQSQKNIKLIFEKYSDNLLEGIAFVFSQNLNSKKSYSHLRVLEETLIALSTIAISLQNAFSKYYNTFMPGLTIILQTIQPTTPQEISIRTYTIECMGYLLTSIKENKQIFNQDCPGIMNELIAMQNNPNIEEDDPHHAPIFLVYGQVAEALQGDFSVYLPQVINKVLKGIDIEINVKISEDEKTNVKDNNKIQKLNLDFGIYGGLKTLQINTSALEQKIEAFNTLQVIINVMKNYDFSQYIQVCVQKISQYIGFKYSSEIKEVAIKSVKHLILASKNDNPQKEQIYNIFLPLLQVQLQNCIKEENVDDCILIISNLAECLKNIKSFSHDNSIIFEQIIDLCLECQKLSKKQKKNIIKEYENQDMDEHTQEEFENKYDEANEIMESMIDIIGQALRLYKNLENKIVNNLLPDFYEVFNKEKSSDNEINIAICVFDEVFQNSSQN
ncbi:Ran binding protein, putative, partial [Ichthyophthirius multifiliis]